MPWGLVALAAIQAGFAIYQMSEQQDAAEDAMRTNAANLAASQSELVREQQQARRRAQGATVLGGSPRSQSQRVSQQGTVLTQGTDTRSLLGS